MSDQTTTHTCANCDETFESERDDDDARAEAVANGFDVDHDDMVVVCDDCYQTMAEWAGLPQR